MAAESPETFGDDDRFDETLQDRVAAEKARALQEPGPGWRTWALHSLLRWYYILGILIVDVQIVERAGTEDLFSRPLHPYTQALLSAIPIPDPTLKRERIVLKGDVPSPAAPPPGCRFHTRCPAVMPICSHAEPPLVEVRKEHWVACHLYPPTEGAAGTAAPLPAAAVAGS